MSVGLLTLVGALGCGADKTVIERCDGGGVTGSALGLVHGRVTDEAGKGVKDISVGTKETKVQTREDGTFELAIAAGEDKVISVENKELSKAATTVRVDEAGVANVELKVSSLETIEVEDAKAGGRFEGKDGFAVVLPEKSLRTKEGKIAEGKAEIRYATIKEPAKMRGAPGEMRTVDAKGKEGRIAPRAIGEVRFYQKGEPLSFKGESARLELPLAGAGEKDGAELDRFYYDEEKGEWQAEGKAKVDKGKVVADVKHFTWWAAGAIVSDSSCVAATLRDASDNPAAFTRVTAIAVDALLIASADTDAEGGVCLPLSPSTDFELTAFFGAGSQAGEWRASVTTPASAAMCGGEDCEDLGEVRLTAVAGPQVEIDAGPDDGGVLPPFEDIEQTLDDTTTTGVASLKFNAVVGQRISFSIKRVTGAEGDVELLAPSGTDVSTIYSTTSGTEYTNVIVLEETGEYVLQVGGRNDATGSYAIEIWGVPEDVVAPIEVDGAKVTVKTTTRNQNAVLTFKAQGGERLAYRASSTIASYTYMTLTAPISDGLVNGAYASVIAGTDATPEAFVLPEEAGTYRLVLDPSQLGIGSLSIELWTVPADATQPITINGPAVSVRTTVRNQNAVLTFTGKGGERLAYTATSDLTGYTYLTLTSPVSETEIAGAYSSVYSGAETLADAFVLPDETGTYRLNLDPTGLAQGTLSVTLWSVPSDATQALTIDRGPQTLAVTTPTQNAQFTFIGSMGTTVSCSVTNNTNAYGYITLVAPSGLKETIDLTSVASMSSGSSSSFSLAETGTYALKIDPVGKAVGTFSASIVGP